MIQLTIENVQDYPRPPALEPVPHRLSLQIGTDTVAETDAGWRVCETHHAPTYYLPADAFAPGLLRPAPGGSLCEWKGRAQYFDLFWQGRTRPRAGWSYPQPTRAFAAIAGHVAVYAWAVDAAFVGEDRALPQPGNFYGGWVTANLRGRIKGSPGTEGW
jgi:uncharacterized protein (DUF427 family)